MNKILLYLFVLLAASCTTPQGEGQPLFVRLQIPDEYPDTITANVQVKLVNTINGSVYTATTDQAGNAAFEAEYGIYRLSTQIKYNDSYNIYLFNGGMEDLRLLPSQISKQDTITLSLTASTLNKIVIKEIYYSGCLRNDGKSYVRDPYLSLYNNSDETVWLDSLCIGITAPIVANKPSNWLKAPEMKSLVPIAYMGWQFSGSGHDYPLYPGQETVIAVNAVNHTGEAYNQPNSVDLSKVDWAFYEKSLTNSDITAGVKPLFLFKKLIATLNTYLINTTGPGIVIYRVRGMSAEAYANTEYALRKEPLVTSQINHLVIPEEWVIDCVDCVEDPTKQGFKRVNPSLDAEAAFLPSGKYSGRSLHRKVAENNNGRIIYQDTNNSAQDFEERIPTLK